MFLSLGVTMKQSTRTGRYSVFRTAAATRSAVERFSRIALAACRSCREVNEKELIRLLLGVVISHR